MARKVVLPGGRIRTELGPKHEIQAKTVHIRLGCAEIYLQREMFTNVASGVHQRIVYLAKELKLPVYVPECGPKRILIKWRNELTPTGVIQDFVERLGVTDQSQPQSKRKPHRSRAQLQKRQ